MTEGQLESQLLLDIESKDNSLVPNYGGLSTNLRIIDINSGNHGDQLIKGTGDISI